MKMKSTFRTRRDEFIERASRAQRDALLILPASPVFLRNNDVEHDFRQDSDFYYLTGFKEPESVLVLSLAQGKMTLFVRPRDPSREVWDGPRAGVKGAKSRFEADEAFPIGDLAKELQKLLAGHRCIYYALGKDRAFDERILGLIHYGRVRPRSKELWPTVVADPGPVLHDMRLFKRGEDLEAMRCAASITGEAHRLAMRMTRPGMFEHEVEGALLETFRKHGSERPAYGSIVGSGPNATVLHYRDNDRRMRAGELLLIDAGCEYGHMASDVTRTFPVSGKFSPEQKAIYEIVLRAQLECIRRTVVGATLDAIHEVAVRVIVRGLVGLGLLRGSEKKIIKTESYKQFFMHRTSHWLGMDVHDVGAYYSEGKARKLEPGMVLTIEPGVYIQAGDKKVDQRWRGIGVRIEDDILVTKRGPVNLTEAIPKTVREIEKACSGTLR